MKILKYLALVLLTAGCATQAPLAVKSASQNTPPPQPDKAQIIFLNPSNSVAGAFLTGVYDVKGSDKAFMGMLGSKMKMVQNVDPGKHLFMSQMGVVAHFMDADVEAGKRYYVLLRFLYGHGFQLRPIRNSGDSEFSVNNPKFSSWVTDCSIVEKTADADPWYAKYKDQVDKAQANYLVEWQSKSSEQKDELTLRKEDAIAN